MKFTLSWLKEFLITNASLKEIADKLTDIGLEVESLSDKQKELDPFIIAKIIKCDKHPEADKLNICQVQNGKETIQIVCGASNARAGIYVVLAPIGTLIPANALKIKASKIRGIDSFGMLCSAEELGIKAENDGIVELELTDNDIGKKFIEIYQDDPVIDINITPNRADCLGVYGIARDLAASGLGTLKPLEIEEKKEKISSPITVTIEEKNLCLSFIGRYFKNINNKPSPKWLKERLEAVGAKSISAIVDITNYISLSYARPLHAYDADKLSGNLTVALAKDKESFLALNGKTYELDNSILTVRDNNGAVAIAGIIGGENSSCSLDTKNIFLEIALFAKDIVIENGRKLDILSDSRARFERGVDANFLNSAMSLTTKLITEICDGEVSNVISQGQNQVPLLEINFDYNNVENLTGLKIAKLEMQKILANLGFKVNDNQITIPSWRHDIQIEADLVEEIARIYGYNNLPLYKIDNQKQTKESVNNLQNISKSLRNKMAALGLNEAITWSFMSSRKANLFTSINTNLIISNPISSELDYLRPTIIPNLLEAATRNNNRGFADLGLFEIGRIFKGTNPEEQILSIAGIKTGKAVTRNPHEPARDVDVFDCKQLASVVLDKWNLNFDSVKIDNSAPNYYHPGKSAELKLGNKIIGYFGEIHPTITKEFGLDIKAVAFEIFLDNLPAQKEKTTTKKNLILSDFQGSKRDFAFIIDKQVKALEIIKKIKKVNPELIEDVCLFDIYTGKNIEDNKKSIAISVALRALDRTLNEQELENVSKNIISSITELGGNLR